MNAVANQTMFQSAYRQISQPERSFVDRLVNLLAESAHRHEQPIRLALGQPMPDTVRRIDKKGWLDRPLVQAAITEEINRIADDQEISPQRWIKEVAAIAQSNVGEFYTVNVLGQPEVDADRVRDIGQHHALVGQDEGQNHDARQDRRAQDAGGVHGSGRWREPASPRRPCGTGENRPARWHHGNRSG